MNDPSIGVFREYRGAFEKVGILGPTHDHASMGFCYDVDYLENRTSQAISLNLPLREEPFSIGSARGFFSGLLPEGRTEQLVSQMTHAGQGEFSRMLQALNDESAGALVFSFDQPSTDGASYLPLEDGVFDEFAAHPTETAAAMGMRTRRSLAGAQPKMGLYHAGDDMRAGWFVPKGVAPTTHIVKNSNSLFPHDSVNEALCMEMARANDLPTAEVSLVPVNGQEPLLAVRRFDRHLPNEPRLASGLPMPWRRHQEDMSQASGIVLKYEPTGHGYATVVADVISKTSSRPFEDRMLFFYALCLDLLVGNCDNHLKNYAMLWDGEWKTQVLAPLYDIANTTCYPNLVREMGIAFCASRSIDDVTADDVVETGRRVGLPAKMAWGAFCELVEDFPATLSAAAAKINDQGFPEAKDIAREIAQEAEKRRALAMDRPALEDQPRETR
ncbi:MAG: HipA domain-containing protein [Atopobiaceae bacterium]|jgi:serine/threonine-protein kinase HipA|nr:HipA domain-containing protein [Atopobiaceae bacterium]